MKNIIEIINLNLFYGKGLQQKKALRNINLSLSKGQICGFLGPNGAGKTTLIKTMLGLLSPRSGTIMLFEKKPTDALTHQAIGYMPETANYYWYLTPKELLVFYAKLFKIKPAIFLPRIDYLLELVDLGENKNKLMKTFSKGMLQKVSFAQCLINDPQLLILDEPTSGFDPIARMNMRNILLDLKTKGKTIFFSSHELSEAEIISDKVIILKEGKILKETKPHEIMNEKGKAINLEQYFFDLVKNE
ncbi:MAG: ABC transporter ATP-binding protein [Candidatus Omnitrophica bacterium]|nr:ABC transporter ATP-binding protein [Candidatus Omnitrophota bacterium]